MSDNRILFLGAVVLLSLVVIFAKGINYGIEFEGGVRIPITFDEELTSQQMEEVSSIIKTRLSKYGLSQVVVRPLPPREVQVELAKGDESSIEKIESLIKQQGTFEAVIDGKIAIAGEDILPGSISEGSIQALSRDSYKWEVDFAVSEGGATRFAAVALGKGGKPVYMFLDRPRSAVILLEPSHLTGQTEVSDIISSVAELNSIEGSDLSIVIVDDWEIKRGIVERKIADNSGRAIIISNSSPYLQDALNMTGNVRIVDDSDMEVEANYDPQDDGVWISRWKAIGLLSAPRLSEGLAQGTPSRLVSVSGTSFTYESGHASAKEIQSILSGGRLPVNAIIGSTISIPAPMGKQFLDMSVLGAAVAFFFIVVFVSARYRKPKLFLPIIIVSVAELVILVAVIGGFGTIDFAAMAGIIAAMGVSIDAQIIITDELFRKNPGSLSKEEMHERVKHAFYIITRNVATSVLAMLPLFFSGVMEIVGFATATILGALLGLAVSRPAYAAIVEHMDL